MQGMDPHAHMQQLAGKPDTVATRAEADTALDEIEYLYDAMDPELHDLRANHLTDRLRQRIRELP